MIDLNLLTLWIEHVKAFPVLSIIARDLLTSQTSTVVSESAFSIGGRVLKERSRRLSPDLLDVLEGLGPCTILNSNLYKLYC